MDLHNFIVGIKKTGFVLEHKITSILKKRNWSVICNKFYEDDLQQTVREIDLIAYKATEIIENIWVYTTIVISCKKNEENVWALLSRNIKLDDPNTNWYPLHFWTNLKNLKYSLNDRNVVKQYYEYMISKDIALMKMPEHEVFAFQELKKSDGKPQNDKNIYNSLISLMKSQSYELNARNPTDSTKRIYQFNLLSLIESDLIKIIFDNNDDINAIMIESEQFLTRYILRRKEEFSRITIMESNSFEKKLEIYDSLHKENCNFFKNEYEMFFKNIFESNEKTNLLLNEFIEEITLAIRIASQYKIPYDEINKLSISYEKEKGSIKITVSEDVETNELLNKNTTLSKKVKNALNLIYKNDVPFSFEDSLPF